MFYSQTIKLREIRESDLEIMCSWKNNPKNYEYFYELKPIMLSQHKSWIEKINQDPSEIMFAISRMDGNDSFLGFVGFQHIDLRNRKAEWGRLLIGDPKNAGLGAGKQVEALMLQYAFEHLGLNKLYCEVLATNTKVIALHKRFGFKEEGVLKKHIFKSGKYLDVVYLSLFAEDYFNNKRRILDLDV